MGDGLRRRRDDEIEKKLRQDALKGIIAAIRGNNTIFNPDRIEGPINENDLRRNASLPPDGNELEQISDGARSFPLTPRGRQQYDNPMLMGNIEALRELNQATEEESEAAHGARRLPWEEFKKGRAVDPAAHELPDNVYAESVRPSMLRWMSSTRDSGTQTFNADHPEFNAVARRHELAPMEENDTAPRGKRKAGRGRRSPRVVKIKRKDIEGEYEPEGMDVIMEEKIEHEFIDGVFVPPEPGKRTFNENDVRGEYEADESGNLQLLADDAGNLVDKQGRRVNEKGYLVNERGDVLDRRSGKPMFRQRELDQAGELPAPHALERYNFTPTDVCGDLLRDENGESIMPNGELLEDRHGRPINA